MGSGHETTNKSVGRANGCHDVALFHWPGLFSIKTADSIGITKKLLNGHQTPFLMRGRGLGTRLVYDMVENQHVINFSQLYICQLIKNC